MSAINQTAFDCVIEMLPQVPAPLVAAGSCIYSNPLINRVSNNWKVLLMDCSTIIAVTGVFLTFVYGMTFFCAALSFVAISTGVGCFYMRRFEELRDLEETARGLRETSAHVESAAQGLREENSVLRAENGVLSQTSQEMQATNRGLQEAKEFYRQNCEQLTKKVAELTIQLDDLKGSATKIREEVLSFQEKNAKLGTNVEGLDQCLQTLDGQISASGELCNLIAVQLASHEENLGQQLEQLKQYLESLQKQNAREKILEVGELNRQVTAALTQLGELQSQSAQEAGRLEVVHDAFVQLKDQFEAALREGNQEFRSNLDSLQQNIVRLLNAPRPASGILAPRTGHPVPTNTNRLSVSTAV